MTKSINRLKKSRNSIISTAFTVLIIVLITGIALGNDYISGFDFESFQGDTHSGCHGGTDQSLSGSLEILSLSGSIIEPGSNFTLSVQIHGFLEANGEDVSLGFANGTPGRGNNDQFQFNVSQYDFVPINGTGSSSKVYFNGIAPSSEGTYTLIADSLEGNSGGILDWVTGEILLNVQYININGPVLENLTIFSNPIEFGNKVNISIDGYDESTSVSTIFFEMNNYNYSMIKTSGSTYGFSWIPDLVGEIPFKIYAIDTEDYVSLRSGSVIIQDSTVPEVIKITQNKEVVTKNESINVQIQVDDQAGISLVLLELNSFNNSMTFIGNDTWQFEWVPTKNGLLDYEIHIQDNNGNWVSVSKSIMVTRIPIDIFQFLSNPVFLSLFFGLMTTMIIGGIVSLRKRKLKKQLKKMGELEHREYLNVKLKEYAENDLIKECANCTMCRDECPTYYSREAESYYAGGRLRVLRAYAERNIPVDDDFIEAMYFCTTCKQCEDRCPVPVNYVDIIEELRSNLVKHGVGPYGKQLGMAKAVHANKNPFNEPIETRKDWCLDDNKELLEGVKEVERGEVGYFVGCTASFRTKDASLNTARILSKLTDGIVILGSGEYCCGSPLIRTGQEDFDLRISEDEVVKFRVKDLVANNVESMIMKDVKEVVYSCSGCYKTSMDDWPRYYEKEIPFKRTHITQYLARKIQEGSIQFDELNKKVTYHDPCHLGRHSNEYDAPREVLKAIPGVELIEMKYIRNRSRCCGSGAGVKAGYPNDALNIAKIRLQEAIDTGADILATSCVFCKFAFIDARKAMGVDIEIANVEDLVVNLLN